MTFPVIYAADEQQNPLPRKTMLFEGDTNSTGGRNDSTLYEGGRGLTIVVSDAKIGREWKIPNTVWVSQGLLADIVASVPSLRLQHLFSRRTLNAIMRRLFALIEALITFSCLEMLVKVKIILIGIKPPEVCCT